MKRAVKGILWTPVIMLLLGNTYCSDDVIPLEKAEAIELINAQKWESTCDLNPQADTNEAQDVGYFQETLLIEGNSAVQTIDYFEDAGCNIPVTDNQVANVESDFFLRQQTLDMEISYPFGTTLTELGHAQHINFIEKAVAIDGNTLSSEELEEQGIVLGRQLGIFIVTDSDRLHLSASSEGGRPTTVPTRYYIRSTDDPSE